MTLLYCPRGEDGYHAVKRAFKPTPEEHICPDHGCANGLGKGAA